MAARSLNSIDEGGVGPAARVIERYLGRRPTVAYAWITTCVIERYLDGRSMLRYASITRA